MSRVEQPGLVVVASPYRPEHQERLTKLFAPAVVEFYRPGDTAALAQRLPHAEIAIVKGPMRSSLLEYSRLRWVHCNQSGLEQWATPEYLQSPLRISSAAGRSAATLAEHAIYFMLALVYRAPQFLRAQRRRVWGIPGQRNLRGLVGRRVLIIGMGHTAKALIPRCQALGLTVTVYRRNAQAEPKFNVPVYSQAAGNRLQRLLPDADIVVLAASLNDSSYRMLDQEAFDCMNPGALLINVARADLMDTMAFKRALRQGTLAGAGIDVTDREPLPPWDSLWRLPNLILTPHVTPQVADRQGAEVDIIADNYDRYRSGQTLRNVLRPGDLYTRGAQQPQPAWQQRLARAWFSALALPRL